MLCSYFIEVPRLFSVFNSSKYSPEPQLYLAVSSEKITIQYTLGGRLEFFKNGYFLTYHPAEEWLKAFKNPYCVRK